MNITEVSAGRCIFLLHFCRAAEMSEKESREPEKLLRAKSPKEDNEKRGNLSNGLAEDVKEERKRSRELAEKNEKRKDPRKGSSQNRSREKSASEETAEELPENGKKEKKVSKKSVGNARKGLSHNRSKEKSAPKEIAEELPEDGKRGKKVPKKSAENGKKRKYFGNEKRKHRSREREEENKKTKKFSKETADDNKKKGSFSRERSDDGKNKTHPSKDPTEEDKNGKLPSKKDVSAELATAIAPDANKKQSSSSGSSERHRRLYGSTDLVKIFIPVSLCMLLVVLCVRNVEVYREEYRVPIPELHDTLYVPPSADTSTKFWHSAKFVALFAIFVVCATFLVLALFYFECYKFLYGYVLLATFMLLLFLSFIQAFDILSAVGEPVSVVLVVFMIYNFVVLALVSIFWKGPLKVQQASLIVLGAMVALTLLHFIPKWTCWLLVVVIAIWDMIAVLTPCGPLRMLVELAEKRDKDMMPAMIYTGSMTFSQATSSTTERSAAGKSDSPEEPPKSHRTVESLRMPNLSVSDEETTIRLGLGDFIFYSLLVGLSSVNDEWTTTIACYVAIMTGLGCTMVLLVVAQHALPALPISILFGVLTVFASRYVMSKLILELNRKLILV